MTNDAPPSFNPVSTIELRSTEASKITKVSLYTGRAEVTRLYQFSVKTGQNQVKISGLPNVLDHDSLRVEGRGAATIHGVTIASTPSPPILDTSETLSDLTKQKQVTEKALGRCKRAITSLESYLATVSTDRVPSDQLGQVLRNCDTEGEQLDAKLLELEAKIKSIDEAIKAEKVKLSGGLREEDERLGLTATIGVFADKEGDVEIALIYAVHQATWRAGYDIRVNMQANEDPVTLIYKAIIMQSTGEAWDDVPLTLETVTPTYGARLPSLPPWRLSTFQPPIGAAFSAPPPGASMMKRSRTTSASPMLLAAVPTGAIAPLPRMMHAQIDIASQGSLSTTFQVPGLISIPSDGENHNVTIVELALDAKMSWISIPRVDRKVHLNAKVKNASEYTLLPGEASVYVDGSFISKSNVPSVSPQECFDCPLGIDPSIRITYHPLSKNVSQSGFYSKTSKRSFTQRVTIVNTKSKVVDGLKLVDHVPISEDSQITVKLINPSLSLPSASALGTISSSSGNGDAAVSKGNQPEKKPLMAPVKVSEGVVAQWDGADDPEGDITALGKDGKFNWICSIPSQGTLNLTLQWEVQSPASVTVTGL